ncbi:hypothetical protein [Catellatospora bangladeshensis]|uniref:hypothetical protein n=1 Tax=Catellatospora bangladeshensis TaxID=310355 RepID=UPI001942B065|nr:hypothetical protein [Catellatospora bangladeshensis]
MSAYDPHRVASPVPASGYLPPDDAFPAEVPSGPEVLVNVPGEGLSGWARKTAGVLRRGWGQQAALFALTHVSSGLVLHLLFGVALLFLWRTELAVDALTDAQASVQYFMVVYGVEVGLMLLVLPVRLLGYSAATWIAVRQAAGLTAPLSRALRYAVRRLPAMFAWQALAYALIGTAMLTMLLTCLSMFGPYGYLPSVVVLLYGMMIVGMVGPAVLFERRKPLQRAFDLVNNAYWATSVRLAVPGAALAAVFWLTRFDAASLTAALGDTLTEQIALVAAVLVVAAALELPVTMLLFPAVLVTYAERRAVEAPTLRTGHLLRELG